LALGQKLARKIAETAEAVRSNVNLETWKKARSGKKEVVST